MHETIITAREAIKKAVDLLHIAAGQFEAISPIYDMADGNRLIIAPEEHQTANELTRLCLDASKKISMQTIRPCDKVDAVLSHLHDLGFVTAVTNFHYLPSKWGNGVCQSLLVAVDQKAIDIWLKYGLSTSVQDEQLHPFLTGWLLGYPTNSIENFWKDDIKNLSELEAADREIYKNEFGYLPIDSVGFNWIYELPA